MKQRKGFTLIELMIVIAIIIILAAIAIPNYLRMNDRARRSRVAGDFTSLATALEAFQVDWGSYPKIATASAFGKGIDTAANAVSGIGKELTGTGTINATGKTTLTGENGGIEYIKLGTIASMYNPFIPSATATVTAHDECYWYVSGNSGANWTLYVVEKAGTYLYRTDKVTDLTETTTTPTAPMT